jgi:hypothetical protein
MRSLTKMLAPEHLSQEYQDGFKDNLLGLCGDVTNAKRRVRRGTAWAGDWPFRIPWTSGLEAGAWPFRIPRTSGLEAGAWPFRIPRTSRPGRLNFDLPCANALEIPQTSGLGSFSFGLRRAELRKFWSGAGKSLPAGQRYSTKASTLAKWPNSGPRRSRGEGGRVGAA